MVYREYWGQIASVFDRFCFVEDDWRQDAAEHQNAKQPEVSVSDPLSNYTYTTWNHGDGMCFFCI